MLHLVSRLTAATLAVIAFAAALWAPPAVAGEGRGEGVHAAGMSRSTYISGLATPVAMAFTPDGRLLVNELDAGRVRVVTAGGRLLARPFAQVSPARYCGSYDEWGLIGLTVDPDFESNRYVYILYLKQVDACRAQPVVVRYTDRDNVGVNPKVIVTLPVTQGAYNHVGGNIHFGPDGYLYISVGDYAVRASNAQDLSVPMGKLLRVNRNGRAVSKNPFFRTPGPDKRVWAYGLRNSFDFDWDRERRRLYATENGPSVDDEVNRLLRGANFGWPCQTGFGRTYSGCSAPNARKPSAVWNPTIAPTGVAFYDAGRFPALRGALLVCDYNTGSLRRLTLSSTGYTVTGQSTLAGGCRYDVEVGSDGRVYFTDDRSIYVLE